MPKIGNIDWRTVISAACCYVENREGVGLDIDTDLLAELEIYANKSLRGYNIENPNAAKVAGHVCFWVRRVKPVLHKPDTIRKFLAVNEEVALLVGLAICQNYFDDARAESFKISPKILKDWVSSLRYNSHSPHALAIAFELITGRRVS